MAAKEILLVTHYFPPERGAASNRMYAMAVALAKNDYNTQIVCPFPNYPKGEVFKGYKGKFYSKSIEDNLTIHRLWVWPSNSRNKFVRLISMLSFSLSLALFFIIKRIPKTVIIQYSPVFVGFTAVFMGWVFNKKTILNVSDLWPLAGLEMGLFDKGFYYSLLERIELFCFRKASFILGQSHEILSYIAKRGVKNKSMLYRNFPRFSAPIISDRNKNGGISLVYAGLLGVAQGLYAICTTLEIPDGITFHIYGSGPETEAIQSLNIKNIEFHGEVSREQLHVELQQYDIAFIPLIRRIYGSVPSKIFEYTRLGIPVLYFAGGEGGLIVNQLKLGWSIPAGEMEALQLFINSLTTETLKEFPKYSVQENSISAFHFEEQFDAFINKIEAL